MKTQRDIQKHKDLLMASNIFTEAQIDLIHSQYVDWVTGEHDFFSFEDEMWYTMNRSGLFEDRQWTPTDTRKYITEWK